MKAMESGEVSIKAPDLREVDEQESDPPSEDEYSLGDLFSVEDMGAEFVFTERETRIATPPSDVAQQPDSAENRRVVKPVREIFEQAGEVLSQNPSTYESWKQKSTTGTSPYEPFSSQIDYGVAKWAKDLGPGDTALSKLLEIPGVSLRFRFWRWHLLIGGSLGCRSPGLIVAKRPSAQSNYRSQSSAFGILGTDGVQA